MYNIIPLILILISLGVIITIIAKKFSALANLNLETVQAEKEARFKERIISNRLKRNIVRWSSKLMKIIIPIGSTLSAFFKIFLKKLYEFKEETDIAEIISVPNLKEKISLIFNEAEELEKRCELVEAEKKYIEIIGLDSQNIKAFEGLANLYFERKEYEEAKQTFFHVLKLKENLEDKENEAAGGNLAQTFFSIALVNKTLKKMDEALINIKKALEIEPNNPRFLDTMLEIGIIIKDKALALEAFNKLKSANPENQKLDELESQIKEL